MTIMSQQAPADAGPASRIAKWAPLAVVLCGTFVWVLDFFVVNVALPDIARSLRANAAASEGLVSGYALASAALLVCGGRLGDHYGRRRWFSIGLATFVLASALCALAPDPGFLVAARLVQGAGGATMAPNILSILGMAYTGPDRVRAISMYGIVMGLAAVGGQLLGGVLINANVAGLGWRAIFWGNVPGGGLALALPPRAGPAAPAPPPAPPRPPPPPPAKPPAEPKPAAPEPRAAATPEPAAAAPRPKNGHATKSKPRATSPKSPKKGV